jgi:flavin reductase (DIM6/NTAB) family NADH-FMN oxidoreductase RutF
MTGNDHMAITPTTPVTMPDTRLHPTAFRNALRQHAASVAVITGRTAGSLRSPMGFTATSVSSASLSPPLTSFYVGSNSRSWRALREITYFAVNLLGAHQSRIAERFAGPAEDRFEGVEWSVGPHGVPVLDDVPVRLLCQRRSAIAVGDHMLVIGLALRADTMADAEPGEPLVHHNGRLGRWQPLRA